jgi:hypothetical protein
MGPFISAFLLSTPINDAAPYFAGYCGEHQLDHPEVEQLAGCVDAYSTRGRGTMFAAGIYSSTLFLPSNSLPYLHIQGVLLGERRGHN